jgi:hypothetical protein
MKNNNVKVLSLLVACALSSYASAEVLKIDSMNITSGTLVRSFNRVDSVTPIVLDFNGDTDLVSGFINKDTTGNSISQTNFKQVKAPVEPTQYTYTAHTNIRHNPEWTGTAPPADGSLMNASYVVPTGTVDDVAGTITLDLSSWFANHMLMNQNLGGIATGQYDKDTGAITDLTWTATLSQGMQKGKTVTWTLQGNVLSTSAMMPMMHKNPSFQNNILHIPTVDVYDANGHITLYKANLKPIPSSTGKLTFELIDAETK